MRRGGNEVGVVSLLRSKRFGGYYWRNSKYRARMILHCLRDTIHGKSPLYKCLLQFVARSLGDVIYITTKLLAQLKSLCECNLIPLEQTRAGYC